MSMSSKKCLSLIPLEGAISFISLNIIVKTCGAELVSLRTSLILGRWGCVNGYLIDHG